MAFSLDPNKFLLEANEFSVPTRANNLRRGQAYYGASQQPGSQVTPMIPPIDTLGGSFLGSASEKENQIGMRMAGDALAAFVDQEAQKELIEAQKSAAKKASRGAMIGGLLGLGGSIIGALCDERAKVDMAPLQTSEVNDDLAQMAFAVQEIRGHS
tara:strand:- start:30 stop:497 length:468 start_codon:yes stop_codon:yes gene_type:complete